MTIRILLTICIAFGIVSCNNNTKKEETREDTEITETFKDETIKINFSEKKQLRTFKQTTFLPALNSNFSTSKNAIYAASFPMAWHEIREFIAEPIEQIENKDLLLLSKSDNYKRVLKEDEYKTSVEIQQDTLIVAKAFFRKSLPF